MAEKTEKPTSKKLKDESKKGIRSNIKNCSPRPAM